MTCNLAILNKELKRSHDLTSCLTYIHTHLDLSSISLVLVSTSTVIVIKIYIIGIM